MLILGSSSPIRRSLLEGVGLSFEVRSPDYDEDALKATHDGDAPSLARALAEGKARAVEAAAGDLVIGGDSVLEVDGRRFDKPRDRAEAAAHLTSFSGRTMQLHSGVALVRDGAVVWSQVDTAHLHVRDLTADFIHAYLVAEWPEVGYCVGVFRMEGRGATLFEQVDGSHFTILGLPLLPLLAALREEGAAP